MKGLALSQLAPRPPGERPRAATPEELYVAPDEVMAVACHEGATPYDVPGVELGHRGADTEARDLTPESRGVEAIAESFRLVYADDDELLRAELPIYDALYATCHARVSAGAEAR